MAALLFIFLCTFRILNALLIQTQFDADEYWQSLEVAYCHVFQGDDCTAALTWEWTRRPDDGSSNWLSLHGPVRSHVSILPTYLWYQAVKMLDMDTFFAVSKGPMLVHAILVAAATDYSVWSLASNISKQTARWSLFCSLTSWFHAYALVRTYSNSIETVLLLTGMVFLSNKKRQNAAFCLGGLSVANRFTSLAAWIPLGILSGMHQFKSWKSRLTYLVYPCATYGLLGFGLSLAVDRYFYGFWTMPVLGNFHFNVLEGMGSLYGTHPWHWYLTAGLPVISGLLLPAIVLDFVKNGNKPMWTVVAVYLLLHSLSAHKEFRFLLPILPLLCIAAGSTLAEQLDVKKRRRLLRICVIAVFVVANLIAFIYLGLIHQRAPLDINKAIVKRMTRIERDGSSTMSSSSSISVHYLMGCHSAPLYSHLHVRGGVTVDAWHLDCSPSCRYRQSVSAHGSLHCESDIFQNDPVSFVQDVYTICQQTPAKNQDDEKSSPNEQVCEYDNVPTFVAIFDSDSAKVKPQLQSMGLVEVDRFFHSIRGARVFGWNLGGTPLIGFTSFNLTSWLEIHANEMVLYQQPS